MNRSDLEVKDQTARFGGVYVETYRGYKIRIKRGRDWGKLTATIADEHFGSPYGYTFGDVAREARSARAYIDDSYERPDAYTWSRKLPV